MAYSGIGRGVLRRCTSCGKHHLVYWRLRNHECTRCNIETIRELSKERSRDYTERLNRGNIEGPVLGSVPDSGSDKGCG